MLSGMRGKGGGYVLTRPPEQYTVGEILRLTEGSLAPVACLDGDALQGLLAFGRVPTLDVWKNLDKLINDYLDGVTLDALVAPNEGYGLRHLVHLPFGDGVEMVDFLALLRLGK